jgi:hypothetical protein
MKSLIISFIASIACTLGYSQTTTPAIDPWTDYMTPGNAHKILATYTGEWNWEITMWMDDSGKPQTVNITSGNQMTLGGRFLEMSQSGDMMGMRYDAKTIIGFNNASKKMELVMYTNLGTGTLYLTGDLDEKSKIANLAGYIVNPMDGTPITVRQVVKFPDNNTIIIENYDRIGDKEKKSIQYKLTRKK